MLTKSIQTACDEVNSISREMQVIMQGDNKHPHINKSGSFSCLRSFELNGMGFSLNKISPITFDVENPQTPADCGIKSRPPTSTPRERRAPQTHNEAANLNEAHHEPSGNASYNPDESITNMSKEDLSHLKQTIWLHSHNNSRHLRKAVKRTPSSMGQDTTEKGVPKAILQGQQMICHKDQPLQHPQHKLEDHHRLPQSPIQTETTRIHRNAMAPPVDPPKHLQIAKPQELLNQKKVSEPHPGTVASIGPATQPSDSSKNTIICSGCGEGGHWSRNCPYYNFCDFL